MAQSLRYEAVSMLHRLTREERVECVSAFAGLTREEQAILSGETPFPVSVAEHLIENVVGVFAMPLGIATGFSIDGIDRLIPMVVEETSIVAAVSATAKWIRKQGSIRTEERGRLIIGQIQIARVEHPEKAVEILNQNKTALIAQANALLPGLVSRGGGVTELEFRVLDRPEQDGKMLVIHVLCDPCDAMGANLINQVCEGLKPEVERLTGERVGLCILSNLVDGKRAFAEVRIRDIDPEVGYGIQEASIFALADPYRATTHNKGVLNGIDPILIATGNDWRAVEAGVHAYAARSGQYQPVTRWEMQGTDLVGTIDVPMAVGTVGGVTKLHPTARVAMKILGVQNASDLARIVVAVGLVQNLGALKALATVGIVRGHMQLHAANLAIAAGAEGALEIEAVKHQLGIILKTEKNINVTRAREVLDGVRRERLAVL